MFTEKRKRGRPAGRTEAGEATRRRLYGIATGLFAERGYDGATLREVAERAGVSASLLYRYFPSKRSVVLAFYDELSDVYALETAAVPRGKWRDRFAFALAASLRVLGPHRNTLRALAPAMVGDGEEGLFARATAFSRERVLAAFRAAVAGATDAPAGRLAEALARVLYLLHLAVILWWLLDRSAGQRATAGLLALVARVLPAAALALRLPAVRSFVLSADDLIGQALLDQAPRPR
jgi:AcrR family transcriptional regulator